jgi:dienelactone hydrolase
MYDVQTRQPITKLPTDRRELMIYVWYPAKAVQNPTPAPYQDEIVMYVVTLGEENMAKAFGVSPETFIKQLTQSVRTNAFSKAPIATAQTRYPVLILSPGFGSPTKLYSALAEQLASHGYIVVGISHTYDVPTLFPGGRIGIQSTLFNALTSKDKENQAFDQATDIRAKDASFVLNELQRLNANDPQGLLAGHIDLNRVGILGHSLGGSTTLEAMLSDRRFQAGILLDGAVYGTLARHEQNQYLQQPLMLISRENAKVREPDVQSFYEKRLQQDGYNLIVKGTVHNSFSDFPLIQSLLTPYAVQQEYPFKNGIGSIASTRIIEVITSYSVAFFNQYLNNQPEPLLKGASSDYPEVVFDAKRPALRSLKPD